MRACVWWMVLAIVVSSAAASPAQVVPAPVADFVGTPTSGVRPLQVSFTDLSQNAPLTWLWTFGDGGVSREQNPTHYYTEAGIFTVMLTVQNQGGESTATRSQYIIVTATAPAPPVALFTASPTAGPPPLLVSFFDESSNTPTSWLWEFGDGTMASEQNPVHEYTRFGIYPVTLTAANRAGSDTATKIGFIIVSSTTPSLADFTAAPTVGQVPLRVKFTDLSANQPTRWRWDFGDGSQISTEENPMHTYDRVGRFTVTLVASNGSNAAMAVKPDLILVLFADVERGFWALDEVVAAAEAGIVTGFPDGSFLPGAAVTREQAAVFLARAVAGGDAGVPAFSGAASFPDVPAGYWALRYVEFAKAHGLLTGFPDGSFRPEQPVTRAGAAVFFARAAAGGDAEVPAFPGVPTFPDVPADSPALRYIEFASSHGLVQGFPDGSFRPAEGMTRDQMAVLVVRGFGIGK